MEESLDLLSAVLRRPEETKTRKKAKKHAILRSADRGLRLVGWWVRRGCAGLWASAMSLCRLGAGRCLGRLGGGRVRRRASEAWRTAVREGAGSIHEGGGQLARLVEKARRPLAPPAA
jgi:hypothetical protein